MMSHGTTSVISLNSICPRDRSWCMICVTHVVPSDERGKKGAPPPHGVVSAGAGLKVVGGSDPRIV